MDSVHILFHRRLQIILFVSDVVEYRKDLLKIERNGVGSFFLPTKLPHAPNLFAAKLPLLPQKFLDRIVKNDILPFPNSFHSQQHKKDILMFYNTLVLQSPPFLRYKFCHDLPQLYWKNRHFHSVLKAEC